MSEADRRLPRLERPKLFVGDGGLETTMIYEEGIELPCFASFLLLRNGRGRDALRRYYLTYMAVARRYGAGFTLDTPTWRANADWGEKLGYSATELAEANRDAVQLLEQLRSAEETAEMPIALCGTIGPRGDAYHPASTMSAEEAERYHASQIATFRETAADMVSAFTLSYAEEAVGIVAAATAAQLPVSIAFTVETDGRLPSGQPLGDAIEQVDAVTGGAAAYFMINCAHPTHFAATLERGGAWLGRLGGIRPNASRKSHGELDRATTLDSGDPDELGSEYGKLRRYAPSLRVLGGCCGTSPRHVASICEHWVG
jgi:S-methylmethionine-dependent homocysteine/selenocysteine methylase